jgi:hypothetical protein
LALSGSVTLSLSQDCTPDENSDNTPPVTFQQLLLGAPQDLGSEGDCNPFTNLCAKGSCTFNEFLALDVKVTNSPM